MTFNRQVHCYENAWGFSPLFLGEFWEKLIT